jgi:hypothetical protein
MVLKVTKNHPNYLTTVFYFITLLWYWSNIFPQRKEKPPHSCPIRKKEGVMLNIANLKRTAYFRMTILRVARNEPALSV